MWLKTPHTISSAVLNPPWFVRVRSWDAPIAPMPTTCTAEHTSCAQSATAIHRWCSSVGRKEKTNDHTK